MWGWHGFLVLPVPTPAHPPFGDAPTLLALQMVQVPPGSCLRSNGGAFVPMEALLATSITHPHICSTFKYAVRPKGSHAGSAKAPKAILGNSSGSSSAGPPGADMPAHEGQHLDAVGEGGRVKSRAEVLGLPNAGQPVATTVQAMAAADAAAQQPQQAVEDERMPVFEGETGAAAREQATAAETEGAAQAGSTANEQAAASAGQVLQPAAALLEAAAEAGPGKAGRQSPQVAQLNTAVLPAVTSDLDSAREEHGAADGSNDREEPSTAGPHVARAEPGAAGASSARQHPGTADGLLAGEQPEGSAAAGPPSQLAQPPLPAVDPSAGKQADVQPEAGRRLGKQEPAEAATATQSEAGLAAGPADNPQLAEPRHRPWHVRMLTFWRWWAGPRSQPAAPVMTAAWNAAAASTAEGDLGSRQAGNGAAAAVQPVHEGQVGIPQHDIVYCGGRQSSCLCGCLACLLHSICFPVLQWLLLQRSQRREGTRWASCDASPLDVLATSRPRPDLGLAGRPAS